MSSIKLIVGLGNPGSQYAQTRHNAGAMFVENLASRFNVELKHEAKFFGLTARIIINGRDVRLLIPTTFMNKSGQSVGAMCNFYKIDIDELLVAYDELDFPDGVAKFKKGGSSSQNGIKDIVKSLANQRDFLRLRIGIGHPGHKSKVSNYVLTKAPQPEHDNIMAAIDESIRCTEILLDKGFADAQQRLHSFNANT